MLVYIGLLSAMLSLWLFMKPKRALQIAMLAAFVLCSLRYDFGNYIHYKWNFVTIQQLGLLEIVREYRSFWDILGHNNSAHAEFGYIFLNWLFSGTTFEWFVAATTGFLFMTVYHLLVRYGEEDYYWFAFLVFVNPTILFVHLSVFRQMIAACLLIWAVVVHLEMRTRWKRICTEIALIAAMVLLHKSAILLLPLLPFTERMELRKLGIAYCLLWLLVPLLETMLVSISGNLGFYDAYTHSERIRGSGIMGLALSAVLSVIFFWIVCFGKGISDPAKKLCVVLYCLMFFTRPLNSRQALYLFNRYELYFDLFAVVALPLVLKQVTDRGARVFWQGALISFFLLRAYLFFLSPQAIGQREFVYTSIFEKGIVMEQNWVKGYEFDD